MVIAVQSFRVRGGRAQDVPGRAGVGVDPETSALDSNGVSKWPKHPHAPGNENDLRESYMFPNKPSYLVHRTVIAKCVLHMWPGYLKKKIKIAHRDWHMPVHWQGLRGFPHSHVSVRVLPVGISVSH